MLLSWRAESLQLDLGLNVINKSDHQKLGYGFNLDVIFGRYGNQFVIGTTKALQKNQVGDLYRSIEMLNLNYRMKNISIGVFYGGVVDDVEDFLSSWNFNDISYQHGLSLELFFKIAKSWNLGLEYRYHSWADDQRGPAYDSLWVNLNYLFSI